MERLAFKMKLNEGQKKAYIKRHNELWPELRILLKDNGVSEYSIFLDEETNTLFAFQKVSGSSGSQDLANNEIEKNGGLLWQTLWKQMQIIRLYQSHWKKFSIWTNNSN